MTFSMMRVGFIYIYICVFIWLLSLSAIIFAFAFLLFEKNENLFDIDFFILDDSNVENAVEYEVTVKTGDKRGAGTGKLIEFFCLC